MSEIVSRPSILCPLCNQRSTKYVCARCALTTAEERDAARAEVARLSAELARRQVIVEAATKWVILHRWAESDSDSDAPYSWHMVGVQLCESVDALRTDETGATDAAT